MGKTDTVEKAPNTEAVENEVEDREDQTAIAPEPPVLPEGYIVLRKFQDDTGPREVGDRIPVSKAKHWRHLSRLVSQRYIRLE